MFLGRVEKIVNQQPYSRGSEKDYVGEQRASVRVEETFKGVRSGELLQLEQPGHNCAPKFEEGARVLFYLHPTKKPGTWEAWGCHRTRSFEDSADDLQFLRALPWAEKRTRLSGEVSVYEKSVAAGFRRVKNLAGIGIQIRSGGKLIETATNSAGVNEIYDLPAGTYHVDVVLPKGMKVRFPLLAGAARNRLNEAKSTCVDLNEGSGVSVDFVLSEDNDMAGRVVAPRAVREREFPLKLSPRREWSAGISTQ